ncbi:MAG: hypothetical protein JRH11_11550 [Deltaproteobacteria bacterium]|nr:hypothetical protein [Deltaproteobacteria bacterium]
MLRIPPALLACAFAAAGLIGCSLDQSALVPQGDAGVRVPPDGGGDAGDAGADSSDSGVDSGRDSGLRPDTGTAPDSSVPDGGCTPWGTGVELCNAVDDDCDPATPDGSGDPMIGVPCDGADEDLCDEGFVACITGAPVCDDATETTGEVCNGSDDDCDGTIDEGVTTLYFLDVGGAPAATASRPAAATATTETSSETPDKPSSARCATPTATGASTKAAPAPR